MTTLYFKTKKAIEAKAEELRSEGEIVTASTMNCACGESSGYYAESCKLILCEACYNDCDRTEQGE